MSTNFKLAWRNIWRNRRRTYITAASVFFGVLLSTFMTSMQEGTYSKMIDNVVSFYSGYIQIHHTDYWENKTIDYCFTPDDTLLESLAKNPEIRLIVPRLESFALMAYANNTKGGALIGVDPQKEDEMSHLSQWVTEGSYLKPNDDGILLAVNLAKNLSVQVNDTVVLLSQGYHGATAAALFPVRGILKFPSPTMNNMGGYIDLKTAQNFFSVSNQLSSLVLMVNDYSEVNKQKHLLHNKLGNQYEIMTWDEMDPLTKNMIDADRSGAYITKGILYTLVGFGIFGTVIMMMAERRKEMGIMVAIGMQKGRLSTILFFEIVLLGFIGVLAGFAFSLPFISYFVYHPIPLTGESAKAYEEFGFEPAMYFSAQWFIFARQVLIIFILTLLVFCYPLIKTVRLKLTKALRA
ncbi:ABC transporter permease [Mangrovibacterium marinum]|uniref:ABC-type lipoprotein release transport system permease subunit n=1 Tax=Mangrovibacterium marinum TaxID=1639118 RepID=A0A2T5C552_9BACT|nr:FtsX-like permease family protein [Mangrovibacterium marinum]PTN09967.1 ABC-type lipoprotein release transport system permease subunit [Mangrovibacterium marinum]